MVLRELCKYFREYKICHEILSVTAILLFNSEDENNLEYKIFYSD